MSQSLRLFKDMENAAKMKLSYKRGFSWKCILIEKCKYITIGMMQKVCE